MLLLILFLFSFSVSVVTWRPLKALVEFSASEINSVVFTPLFCVIHTKVTCKLFVIPSSYFVIRLKMSAGKRNVHIFESGYVNLAFSTRPKWLFFDFSRSDEIWSWKFDLFHVLPRNPLWANLTQTLFGWFSSGLFFSLDISRSTEMWDAMLDFL